MMTRPNEESAALKIFGAFSGKVRRHKAKGIP